MERKILFRGKRVDNGEWVYGFYNRCEARLTYTEENYKNNPRSWIQTLESDGFAGSLVHVDTDTVGQYTGLIDEDGVKIFEGDIVNCKTVPITLEKYIVRWDDSHAKFIIEKQGKDFSMTDSFEYEIIGNIFDNPELMESGRQNNG